MAGRERGPRRSHREPSESGQAVDRGVEPRVVGGEVVLIGRRVKRSVGQAVEQGHRRAHRQVGVGDRGGRVGGRVAGCGGDLSVDRDDRGRVAGCQLPPQHPVVVVREGPVTELDNAFLRDGMGPDLRDACLGCERRCGGTNLLGRG